MNPRRPKSFPQTSTTLTVVLKMRGTKRNCRFVSKKVEWRVKELLEGFDWNFTGSGKVDILWGVTVKP